MYLHGFLAFCQYGLVNSRYAKSPQLPPAIINGPYLIYFSNITLYKCTEDNIRSVNSKLASLLYDFAPLPHSSSYWIYILQFLHMECNMSLSSDTLPYENLHQSCLKKHRKGLLCEGGSIMRCRVSVRSWDSITAGLSYQSTTAAHCNHHVYSLLGNRARFFF